MLQVHSVEVDKTSDFADMLEIPWYGNQLKINEGAFTPGRITSMTTIEFIAPGDTKPETLLIVWWDQPAPTPEEMQAAALKDWEEFMKEEEE